MYKQSVEGHMGSDLIYHTDCTHCCVDTPPARGGETFASITSTEDVAQHFKDIFFGLNAKLIDFLIDDTDMHGG